MKRYISSSLPGILEFTIDVILTPDTTGSSVAATYNMPDLPQGPVISGNKLADIDPQVVADYDAFVETIEDLLTEYHGLELVYKNKSKDFSRYYSFLARDSAGNVILKFRLRLRISNHTPHRTKAQQANKAAEAKSEKLLKLTKGKKLQIINKQVIVNDTVFDDYDEAYFKIAEQVEKWVKIMKRVGR